MKMACSQFALWLLARADRAGRREALVGDLLEEIAHGRSRYWVWQQVIGLGWFALVARARQQARVTPHLIALAISLVLLGGVSITSLSRVLETWAGLYLLAGTLSLFADVMSRSIGSRALVIVDTVAGKRV
jgi:hypothetical protein